MLLSCAAQVQPWRDSFDAFALHAHFMLVSLLLSLQHVTA